MLQTVSVLLLGAVVTCQNDDTSYAVDYLGKYLPRTMSSMDESPLKEGFKNFQKFASVDPTVKLSPLTTIYQDPVLCKAKLDAAVQTSDGMSYVFSGDSYWTLNGRSNAESVRKISSDWPGLPDNIDAAVTWQEYQVTYFFKRDQYWRFTDREPSSGYPKNISIWGGLPGYIDAAFAWNKNLYFFKDSQYWMYKTTQGIVPEGYPRSISEWRGVPEGVDAAFEWGDGRTYVFKDDYYWRLNSKNENVDRINPRFPRYASGWFGCPQKNL